MTVAPLVMASPLVGVDTDVTVSVPSMSESLPSTDIVTAVSSWVTVESSLDVGKSFTDSTVTFTVAVAVAPSESVIV